MRPEKVIDIAAIEVREIPDALNRWFRGTLLPASNLLNGYCESARNVFARQSKRLPGSPQLLCKYERP
jgi:hypothetical protein